MSALCKARARAIFAVATVVIASALVGVARPQTARAASAPLPSLNGSTLALTPVATGLPNTTALAWRAGDARMYVSQKTGTIRLVNTNGTLVPTPVLTVSVLTTGEQGLSGLVFSPDGTKLYVDYVGLDSMIHLVEYTMAGDVANVGTARELLTIAHPTYTIHYSGDLQFGPDGDLYVSVGDGGSFSDSDGNAQNLNVLLGKILRINPAPDGMSPYTIPTDNPFFGQSGKRGEIWMYGFRNPWRYSFDRATGDMYIGDVGQHIYEEIDYAPAGLKGTNWGWPLREGFHEYSGAIPPGARDPLVEVSHKTGACAIIGGYVYRGSAIPMLDGAYVYGDLCRGALVGVVQRNGQVFDTRDLKVSVTKLTTFGQDASGELYVGDLGGTVYKLTPGSVLPTGYWQAGFDGRAWGYHGAESCNTTHPSASANVVGIAGTPSGFWTTSSIGVVSGCRVMTHGATAGMRLNRPIVGIASTPTGNGYWLVASDGGVFSFGDARFFGSTGSIRLNQPIVGITPTPTGNGYWLVASDGGVFSFGDARFFGSTGSMHLNQPIVGMATTRAGTGYWLVASDGGVFTFGHARFLGSQGGKPIAAPIMGMSATPTGNGYWLTGFDGAVFSFGDVCPWGSAHGTSTAIVGIAHN